jgi:WD40 repeat protein
VILWNITGDQARARVLSGASRLVSSLAFSPDGRTLAAGVYDKTIMLWDVETGQSIGQPLAGHLGSVFSVAFSPDGRTLASGSIDNSLIFWDLDPQSWIAKSCQRAGRNFTRSEWAQFFQDEEYRQTCEQWSLEGEPSSSPGPTS